MRESTRGEITALLQLGAPIMLAELFQIGMQVVDTIMAGRYGPTDLAGIALASSVYFPARILLFGILQSVTPIVAQLHGAGREDAVGSVVRQGVWIACTVSLLLILFVLNGDRVLGLFNVEPDVARIATGYLRALLWGLPGLALFLVFRMTCEGMGKTRPAMLIGALSLAANVPLNYAFIYGKFGAPELGGIGCGVATAIIRWVQCAVIFRVITLPYYERIHVFSGSWALDFAEWRRMAKVGLPIGFKVFAAVGMFALATLLIAPFGEAAVAAGSVAGNVTTVVFMIPLGLGVAAGIRVGHSVGAKEYARADLAGRTGVQLAVCYAVLIAAALALLRSPLAALYTTSPEVLDILTKLFLIVAAYQFMDCSQEAAVGALRGYKDTTVPMVIALSGYWFVAFPVGLSLGYGWITPEPLGVYGFWIGFACGEGCIAVALNIRRFRLSKDHARIQRLAADES